MPNEQTGHLFKDQQWSKYNKKRLSLILIIGVTALIIGGILTWAAFTGRLKIRAAGEIANTASATYSGGSATSNTLRIPIVTPTDTQAPTVPTNVAGRAISCTQIDLTWTASTDNVGVTGYKIKRNGTEITDRPATNAYSDKAVVGGQGYTYQVAAFDAAGNTSSFAPVTPVSVSTPSCEQTGNLTGKVTDAKTSSVLAGATVTLTLPNNTTKITTTAADGTYRYDNLQPGTYTVKVAKKGYFTQTQSTTIVSGQTANVNFGLPGKGRNR